MRVKARGSCLRSKPAAVRRRAGSGGYQRHERVTGRNGAATRTAEVLRTRAASAELVRLATATSTRSGGVAAGLVASGGDLELVAARGLGASTRAGARRLWSESEGRWLAETWGGLGMAGGGGGVLGDSGRATGLGVHRRGEEAAGKANHVERLSAGGAVSEALGRRRAQERRRRWGGHGGGAAADLGSGLVSGRGQRRELAAGDERSWSSLGLSGGQRG